MKSIHEGIRMSPLPVEGDSTKRIPLGTLSRKDASVVADPGTMSATCVISTENKDHSGDVMVAAGAVLDTHIRNPVVLLNHGFGYDLPIGKAEDALGNYSVRPGLNSISSTTWFSQKSLIAAQVFDLVNEKILKGASIGFKALDWVQLSPVEGNWYSGMQVNKWLLLEYSHVTIPDNPEALVDVVGKNLLCGKPIEAALYKSLQDFVPPKASLTLPTTMPGTEGIDLHRLGLAAVASDAGGAGKKSKPRDGLKKKRREELTEKAIQAAAKLIVAPLKTDEDGDETETESAPAQSGKEGDTPKKPAEDPDPKKPEDTPKEEPTVPEKVTAAAGRKDDNPTPTDVTPTDATVVEDEPEMVDDRPPGAIALDNVHAQILALSQSIEDIARTQEKEPVVDALNAFSATMLEAMSQCESVYAATYPEEDPIAPSPDAEKASDESLTTEDVPEGDKPESEQKRVKRLKRKSRIAARVKFRVGVKKLSKGIVSKIKDASGYLEEVSDHAGEMKSSQKSAAKYHAAQLKALCEEVTDGDDTLSTPGEADAKRLRAENVALKSRVKSLTDEKSAVEQKCIALVAASKKLLGQA